MLSGKPATGKNPLEASYEQKFGPADVALAVNRNPDLKAVGVFTGIRGNGIVILDVDRNLSKYLKAGVLARWRSNNYFHQGQRSQVPLPCP